MINRRAKLPSRWALLVLGTCCVLSMIITFRAGAQNAKPAAGTTAAAADAKPADAKAGDAKPATPASKDTKPPAAPSKQEESATIPDDPTLVPDDKESADNNVTFPVDI